MDHSAHRGFGRSLVALTALLFLTAPAGRVSAWTRASVTGAQAHVDVEASGRALVKLELEMRVDGGWLSRLELAGFDGALGLDEDKPPSLLTEDGRKLRPVAELDPDGHLVLSFRDRHEAAHRGLHHLQIVYLAQLPMGDAASPELARVSVTLPAWPVDLQTADVWVSAPAGSRFVVADDQEREGTVGREQVQQATRALLHWHRVQLPRTSSFIAEFDMPASGALPPRSLAPLPVTVSDTPATAYVLATLLVLLCALKRRCVHVLAQRSAAVPLPLLSTPTWILALLLLGTAFTAAYVQSKQPMAALLLYVVPVALTLQRGYAVDSKASPRGTISRRHLPLLWSSTGWLDATTPLGACLLASACAVAGMRLALGAAPGLWLEGLLIAAPLWLNATRLALPKKPATAPVSAEWPEGGVAETDAPLRRGDAGLRAPDRAA